MIPEDSSWVLHKIPGPQFDFMFFCPGCECCHGFNAFINREPRWNFNGDMLKPTLSPSILVNSSYKGVPTVCHSFIKDGMIQFLNDCTHALAGKTVRLEPF